MLKPIKVFQLLTVVLLLFIMSRVVMASTTNKTSGIVTDKETGDVLPEANVILEGTNLSAATNLNGQYFILNMPLGVYTIKAGFIGYQTISVVQFRVNIDLATTVDFQLPSEALEVDMVVIVGPPDDSKRRRYNHAGCQIRCC